MLKKNSPNRKLSNKWGLDTLGAESAEGRNENGGTKRRSAHVKGRAGVLAYTDASEQKKKTNPIMALRGVKRSGRTKNGISYIVLGRSGLY